MNCNILVAILGFNWILKIYMLLFNFGTNINGKTSDLQNYNNNNNGVYDSYHVELAHYTNASFGK